MRVTRIFTGQPMAPGREIELEAEAVRHLVSVLRLKSGAPLVLFNGSGGEYSATLGAVSGKRATALIGEFNPENRESPLFIVLGIGISKGDRMDWIVQKATELGVAAIAPLLTTRTEVRLNPQRWEKKLRHWHQIVLSACEQCGRNLPPALSEPQDLHGWLQSVQVDRKWVMHPGTNSRLPDGAGQSPASAALLVGPEGGLDSTEVDSARAAGFQPLSLGPRVLRTETAPLSAISILQARWGDLN